MPHVPLIEPVKTQIARATHSGTELRGRQLFTMGMGLVMGSVLALVLGEVVPLSLAAVVFVTGGVFSVGLNHEWRWVGSIVDGFTSVVLAGVLERPDLTTGAGRKALANRHNNPERDRAVLLRVFRRSMGLEKAAQRRADRISRKVNALNVPSALKPLLLAAAKTINSVGYATGVVLNVSYHAWNNLVAIAVKKKWMTEARAMVLLGRRPVMAHAVSKPEKGTTEAKEAVASALKDVLAPNGMPQAVDLKVLKTLVGDSKPVLLDPRFRGNLGPATPETDWAAMAEYLGNLNVEGDGGRGAAAVETTGGETLTSEFVQTLQSSNANDIASHLLSLAKGIAGSDEMRTLQNLNNLFAGAALLHAKGSALLAQASEGGVPAPLAGLREAQAQDIHLLVQVAALTGVTAADNLNNLFFRHYDETMKMAGTLARLEAKGAEDARGDTGTLLTVNLNGLEDADVPGAIAYIVGAAKARKEIQGAVPVAVTSLFTIRQLTEMNPALGNVASQVVAVTPSQAQELYLEGRLSVKALVLFMKSQQNNVTSLDVVSPGEGSVLQDQGRDVTVTVRDYYSIIRAIADEIKGMVFVLLQA